MDLAVPKLPPAVQTPTTGGAVPGLYSSVAADAPLPLNANPAACDPAPAKLYLAVDKLPPALHVAPSYSSVAADAPPAYPPNANPALCVPAPAKLYLAVPILPPALQADPSYSSVAADAPPALPPNANPAD